MSIIGDLLTNAFVADVAVKVEKIRKGKVADIVLQEVYHLLSRKYGTLLDKENGVIYLKTKGG